MHRREVFFSTSVKTMTSGIAILIWYPHLGTKAVTKPQPVLNSPLMPELQPPILP
jgi:hypothetical protein